MLSTLFNVLWLKSKRLMPGGFIPLWQFCPSSPKQVFSICTYLDPASWHYFCLVKDKFSNPYSQRPVRIPNPGTEQSLAARNRSKSPPFSGALTGFILLTVHPAFYSIKSHSLDFKDLQSSHLILLLWSHVNLPTPETPLIAFICTSVLPNSPQWRIVISFVWVHLFGIFAPVTDSLPLQQTLSYFILN